MMFTRMRIGAVIRVPPLADVWDFLSEPAFTQCRGHHPDTRTRGSRVPAGA
ncbi:hypothetical protein [Microbacterium pumilum]|uniref:hypothetical protein n=1 Tax=Microbacterium pumilum TaxID=344165 RepID=UPI0031DA10E8